MQGSYTIIQAILTYIVLGSIEAVEIEITQDTNIANVPIKKVVAISKKKISGL